MKINFHARMDDDREKDGYEILKHVCLPKEKISIRIEFTPKKQKTSNCWIGKWLDSKIAS